MHYRILNNLTQNMKIVKYLLDKREQFDRFEEKKSMLCLNVIPFKIYYGKLILPNIQRLA